GLTIGVAAFIAVVSFGVGARTAVLTQFEGLGVNVLRVRMRSVSRQSGRQAQLLTDRDVAMLRSESSAIGVVVPSTFRTGIFGHSGARMRGSLIATEPQYALIQRLTFVSGGMFDALDNSTAARVCVLGAGTASKLFSDGDPVGQSLSIGAHFVCRVVGVVSHRVGATSGSEVNEFVLVPARTFQENIERTGYSYIDVRPVQPELHEVARTEAGSIMRRAHRYDPEDRGAELDFDVVSPDDISHAADRTAVLLTGLLAAVAGVSLLVGGIGIMNLQLVAVSERAQEIGIRAAIGAAPQQIVRQFLMESSVLS